MTPPTQSIRCHCGSELLFTHCCEPHLQQSQPIRTPEALLRARYSAYCRGDLGFIEATMTTTANADYDPETTRQWLSQTTWLGLEISQIHPTHNPNQACISFATRFTNRGQTFRVTEDASFECINNQWYYNGAHKHS